jgi:hypothetical protein
MTILGGTIALRPGREFKRAIPEACSALFSRGKNPNYRIISKNGELFRA